MKNRIFMRTKLLPLLSTLAAFAFLLSIPGFVSAETTEVTAQGRVQYKSRKPKAEDRNRAVEQAKKNALDEYASSLPTSARKNYIAIEEKLKNNVDKYVKNALLIDEETDKDSKTYMVFIRATVDQGGIDIEIQSVAGGGQFAESEYILFVFSARSENVVKGYDDRRTTRTDVDLTDDIEETAASDGQTALDSASRKSSAIKVTGGSTVQQERKITYKVFSSEAVDSAVSQVFTEANFEVVPMFDVDEQITTLFQEDFGVGDDVSGKTRKYATNVARENEIPFFAYGLLEAGKSRVDDATGDYIVTVRVNAKVFDLSKRFAKVAAAVGPVQYRGQGKTVSEAQSNALRTSARQAAQDLTNQLMAKGIR